MLQKAFTQELVNLVDIFSVLVAAIALIISIISYKTQKQAFKNADMPEFSFDKLECRTSIIRAYAKKSDSDLVRNEWPESMYKK